MKKTAQLVNLAAAFQLALDFLEMGHEHIWMRKVLIIKLGALGDMLRAAPAIRRLCQHYSEGNVSILTIADLQELARELFGKTITVLASPRHKGIAALRTGLLLRQRRFDIVTDLQGNTF